MRDVRLWAERAAGLPVRAAAGALLGFAPSSLRESIHFEARSALGRLLQPKIPLRKDGPNYLNLGCGPLPLTGFINVDSHMSSVAQYRTDLRQPLQAPDRSIDGIFSEHTFEHLSYAEAARLLGECLRVMKPRAVIRIVVPDLSRMIRAYVEGDAAWFAEWERLMLREHSDASRRDRRFTQPMEAISFLTQEYGHVSCWDHPTLHQYLRDAGFEAPSSCEVGKGRDPALVGDSREPARTFISAYVEAIRP